MKKPDLYQIVIILLIVAILVALGLFIYNLTRGKVGKAALSVDVVYDKAKVLLDGQDIGETPVYKESIMAKQMQIDVNGANGSYSTSIKPTAGTLAHIKRDLGVGGVFSSGMNLWFEKIGGTESSIQVISPDVESVSVVVDGVEMGKTPVKFSVKDLLSQSEDGKYSIKLTKEGYEDQIADVKIKEGYELVIKADMFLKPLPLQVGKIESGIDGAVILNLSNVSNPAFQDKQLWAKAINYWISTRPDANLGNDVNAKIEKFNYFVDDSGKVYNESGNEIKPDEAKLQSGMFTAYLGSSQSVDPTNEAKTTLSVMTGNEVESTEGPAATGTEDTKKSIKIKTNALGYLRVRAGAGQTNAEVGKAEIGRTYAVKAEQNGWYKIEYETGKEGWVSGNAQYVEVVSQ